VYALPEFNLELVKPWKSFEHAMRQASQREKAKKAEVRQQKIMKIQAKQTRRVLGRRGRRVI
jgi:hypothetical protein